MLSFDNIVTFSPTSASPSSSRRAFQSSPSILTRPYPSFSIRSVTIALRPMRLSMFVVTVVWDFLSMSFNTKGRMKMNARNVPTANNPTCQAIDKLNADPTAENKHPTDKQAIAKPLVQISMMKKSRAAITQICQISMMILFENNMI